MSEECPHCGEPVPSGRPACPHCGSDAETGWADPEEVQYRSVELPEPPDTEPRGRTTRRRLLAALGFGLAFLALILFLL